MPMAAAQAVLGCAGIIMVKPGDNVSQMCYRLDFGLDNSQCCHLLHSGKLHLTDVTVVQLRHPGCVGLLCWWVDAKPTLDPKPGNLDHGHKPSVLGDTDVTFLLAGISPGRVGPARIDGLRQPSAQGPTQKRTKTINKQSTVLLKIRYLII